MGDVRMNIVAKDDKVIVENLKDFDVTHVFDCGQCFRFYREDDASYTGVAFGRVINVSYTNGRLIIDNTNIEDFENIWRNFFDLDRDYESIKNELALIDDTMKKSIDFGQGIRIIKQDEWETLISFITSANNRIPMIKRAIEGISEKYGKCIGEYRGKKHYSFPSADVLNGLKEEDIKLSGVGFRAKYILDAARCVADNEIDIYSLKDLNYDDAKKELMKIKGVGPKVSDCILLFSMDKQNAFPVDVWVKRVMEYFYFPEGISNKEIGLKAYEKFGELAGFAQQYLFYYARELKIGK